MKQGWIQVNSNNTQEPLAPKTMADMVYMDETQSQSVKDAILANAPLQLTAALPSNGWSASAPYTQTVQVTGLLATDTPLVDVVLSDAAPTAQAQLEAYGCIGRIDTAAGAMTVTCYEYKPTSDVAMVMKVVR